MVNHNSPSDNVVNDSDFYGNNHSNNHSNNNVGPAPSEGFTNLSGMGVNVDLVLKSIFYGAIFYLLSLPDVYKMTAGVVGKKVDGVLVHGIVFAVLYYILTHFI